MGGEKGRTRLLRPLKETAHRRKKVWAVRRESLPAWCMGPMRATESSSAGWVGGWVGGWEEGLAVGLVHGADARYGELFGKGWVGGWVVRWEGGLGRWVGGWGFPFLPIFWRPPCSPLQAVMRYLMS